MSIKFRNFFIFHRILNYLIIFDFSFLYIFIVFGHFNCKTPQIKAITYCNRLLTVSVIYRLLYSIMYVNFMTQFFEIISPNVILISPVFTWLYSDFQHFTVSIFNLSSSLSGDYRIYSFMLRLIFCFLSIQQF